MRCLAFFVEYISDGLEAHAKLEPARSITLLYCHGGFNFSST